MARQIVDLYHGAGAGERGGGGFDRVHKDTSFPETCPKSAIDASWVGEGGRVWLPASAGGAGPRRARTGRPAER